METSTIERQQQAEPEVTRLGHGINHLAYSPDGKLLACSDVRMNVRVIERSMDPGTERSANPPHPFSGYPRPDMDPTWAPPVEFDRIEKLLLTRNLFVGDDKIRPTQRIRGLEFTRDSEKLVIAAADTLHCVDSRTG